MNRSLQIALAVVAALSLYLMGSEPDDDVLAPAKPRAEGRSPAASRAPSRTAVGTPAADAANAATAKLLIDGVTRWRDRQAGAGSQEGPPPLSIAAWAAVAPPPPPEAARLQAVDVREEAPPMAPPFPHDWVGRFNDAGGTEMVERAVLNGPRNTLVVKAGDVIESQWRIDGIRERTMNVTYLPLNQPQTVAMK